MVNQPMEEKNTPSSANPSMGDLQDPTDGGTLVPYVWPYELWGYSLT